MKIAYCVEGSADRAIVHGLHDRWCPQAELVEGHFRGQIPRSQIAKECRVLAAKGADLIVFLRDANREKWQAVLQADKAKCHPKYCHLVLFGVCDRNAECWLATDADHLAAHLGRKRNDFAHEDPSPAVKAAFGLIGFDKDQKEHHVASYVVSAPLKNWLKNKSFENFYEKLWRKSMELGCKIENLHESARRTR